jgi:hypothetical protein
VLPGRRNTRSGREAGEHLVLVTSDWDFRKKFMKREKKLRLPSTLPGVHGNPGVDMTVED